MSAIYGANGAGKSNLLKCIALLKSLVGAEKMGEADIAEDLYFKLNENGKNTPSELAVEFFTEGKIFYYHLRFNRQEVFEEELLLSQKNKDIRIFSRKDNDINVSGDYLRPGGKDDFIEVFMNAMNRIVRPDMLALSFFGKYYPEELPVVKEAFDWIKRLQVVLPTMRIGYLPHVLDGDSEFEELVNSIMPELKTGITKLCVRKEILNEDEVRGNSAMTKAINAAKEHPGSPQMLMETHNNEISNIVLEDGVPYLKTLIAVHSNYEGKGSEPDFFSFFEGLSSNLELIVIPPEEGTDPLKLMELAERILLGDTRKHTIDYLQRDKIWFAIDTDSWEKEDKIAPLRDFCKAMNTRITEKYSEAKRGMECRAK